MSKKKHYRITEVKQAKEVAHDFLKGISLEKAIDFGLPEIDDRYHIWRVPLLSKARESVGEVVIDALTTFVNEKKTTTKEVLESRLLGRKNLNGKAISNGNGKKDAPKISNLRNTVGLGDSELSELENAIKNTVDVSRKEFGELQGKVAVGKETFTFNWEAILQIFTGVGAQTLAIRGSEKSMYGKFFERLILGSLLSLLGFELIAPASSSKSKNVFWLSQRGDKRESDATLLFKPGTGARFDIGFIGPGNTEISLDKVSRFEREMEFGRSTHFMSTIILVDRIGDGSRIVELAQKIHGSIVQMSMNFWVKQIAQILHEKLGFKHPILKLSNEQSLHFIEEKMKTVDFKAFSAKKLL